VPVEKKTIAMPSDQEQVALVAQPGCDSCSHPGCDGTPIFYLAGRGACSQHHHELELTTCR